MLLFIMSLILEKPNILLTTGKRADTKYYLLVESVLFLVIITSQTPYNDINDKRKLSLIVVQYDINRK